MNHIHNINWTKMIIQMKKFLIILILIISVVLYSGCTDKDQLPYSNIDDRQSVSTGHPT